MNQQNLRTASPANTRSKRPAIRKLAAATLVALSAGLVGITVLAQNYPPLQTDKAASIHAPVELVSPTTAIPEVPATHTLVGPPTVFQGFEPCRVIDTRNANGTYGGPKLVAGATRSFDLDQGGFAGSCGNSFPTGVKAMVVNVTLVNEDGPGFVTIHPGGTTRPTASSINSSGPNTVIGNMIVMPLAADGTVSIYTSVGTHLVMDLVGFFLNDFDDDDSLVLSGNTSGTSVFNVTNNNTGSSNFSFAIRGGGNTTGAFTGGVYGVALGDSGFGVYGAAQAPNSVAVRGGTPGNLPGALAGVFGGNVTVTGTLTKGAGSFKIDHPQDPAKKYLSHSFVESPDMMNVYNGNITTDEKGRAVVTMPEYFSALNADFRYQLTVLGEEFAQALVASEMKENKFVIKTSKPNVKISWQVTGVRHDAYANANRIAVEEEKKGLEIGAYLHPELFGQPEEKSIDYAKNPALYRLEHPAADQAKIQTAEAQSAAASGSGGR